MIFGHNHAFTSIVNTFGNSYIENVPTSGLVMLEFNINNWQDLTHGKTALILFPKDLLSNYD
jgi:phosphohistidine phosphatase